MRCHTSCVAHCRSRRMSTHRLRPSPRLFSSRESRAIAVALLAGLDPWRVVLSATLFAALEAGAGAMQRDANVPATLVSVIEALLILAVVAAQAIRWRVRQSPATSADTVLEVSQ